SSGKRLSRVSVVLVLLSLFLLSVEVMEQAVAVTMTWNRRSVAELTAFVERNVRAGSTVYGPFGSYFYSVELAGSQYLYPFEHTTPGLYSEPPADARDRLVTRIFSGPTYAMWPTVDPGQHPESQSMPDALRERLGEKVDEFDQPPLAKWK